ncbi:MAG: glycosyltransferase family 39 protein [Candidatus Aenigmatarchaeota archaeon]
MEIELKKEYIGLILILIIGILFIYLAPQTNLLGEDEEVYFSLGKEFSQGKFPLFKHTGGPANVVPLLPLIFVPFFLLFGTSLGVAKMVVAIFGILTIIMVYFIGRQYGLVAAISSIAILLSIPIFVQLSMLSYTDIPIAFFSILAMFIFMKLDSSKKAILGGVILALAFYTKQTGSFLALVFLLYGAYKYVFKKDKKYIKFIFTSLIIFGVLIAPWIIKNIIFYNYPYFEGLNLFFPGTALGTQIPQWMVEAVSTLSPRINFISAFGHIALIITLFGIIFIALKKEEKFFLPILMFVMFFAIFYFGSFTGRIISEARYFTVILPQLAIIGGLFLQKLSENKKTYLLIVIIIIGVSIFSGLSLAFAISNSVRYPSDYVEALKWIKENTPQDSKIFTAYSGSVKIYADRNSVWGIEEFPDVMTTQDSNYIYRILKNNNVSYILIWSGILSDRYIIPESNLFGAFTYNFLNVVNKDQEHFKVVFQNQNNIIFELM